MKSEKNPSWKGTEYPSGRWHGISRIDRKVTELQGVCGGAVVFNSLLLTEAAISIVVF